MQHGPGLLKRNWNRRQNIIVSFLHPCHTYPRSDGDRLALSSFLFHQNAVTLPKIVKSIALKFDLTAVTRSQLNLSMKEWGKAQHGLRGLWERLGDEWRTGEDRHELLWVPYIRFGACFEHIQNKRSGPALWRKRCDDAVKTPWQRKANFMNVLWTHLYRANRAQSRSNWKRIWSQSERSKRINSVPWVIDFTNFRRCHCALVKIKDSRT